MSHIPPVLSRREHGANRFFAQVEEDLTAATGPYTYHFIESKWNAVVVVPLLSDGRLVVERIYRHPYRTWLHEFPAGGIGPGEDPCAAGVRELEEETGYRAARCRPLGTFEPMPGLLRMRLHVVLAEDLVQTGRQQLEAMEMLEVVTMTRTEAWSEAERQPASSFLVSGLLYLNKVLPVG